jgi:LPXTG-site transpeptidase (sortase) family protein
VIATYDARVTLSTQRQAARHELAGLCSELDTLAVELALAPSRARRRLLTASRLLTALGVALIAGGLWFAARPLVALLERSRADQTAMAQWNHGGSRALMGSAPATGADHPAIPSTTGCGGSSADSYALLSFPSLAQYGYSGVAGDGGWDELARRSMVHFHGSAAPGAAGNDIIGFHREPNFQHIDQLAVGDTVVVQDRSCRVWHYVIGQRWVLPPDRVTQLGATSEAVLTLITCDPWFRDDNRIVWRASLTDAPAPPGP